MSRLVVVKPSLMYSLMGTSDRTVGSQVHCLDARSL